MNNDTIHTTESNSAVLAPEKKDYLASVNKILPPLHYIFMALLAIAIGVIGFRDTQTSQAQSVKELQRDQDNLSQKVSDIKAARDKQIDELKADLMTKKEFEAYWKQVELLRDENRQMRSLLERSLER